MIEATEEELAENNKNKRAAPPSTQTTPVKGLAIQKKLRQVIQGFDRNSQFVMIGMTFS